MKLAGTLDDFSLTDFLQVQGAARRTGQLKILGDDVPGKIYLSRGQIAHAEHGGLRGERAFFSLVSQSHGYFEFNPDRESPETTIERSLVDLLMDSGLLQASGAVPRPTSPHEREAEVALPRASRSQRRLSPVLWAAVPAFLLLAAASLTGWLPPSPWGSSEAKPSREPALEDEPSKPSVTYEAAALTGPRDRPPKLLEGLEPISPNPDLALQPTVVCRILVDRTGAVQEAAIFRSRLEIKPFEEAALIAVAAYRFEPGFKEGVPVATHLNWPVRFRQEELP